MLSTIGRIAICCLLLALAASAAWAQDVDDLKNGIVKIRAQQDGVSREGTGFIVRLQGDSAYIVTAAHVVEGDAHPGVAFFPRANQFYRADLLGIEGGDPRGVAALLVRDAALPPGLRAFTVSSSVNVRGGEPITVIGFPREFGTPWMVVEGSIGGRRGSDISFSAVIGEGSSGGPLLLNSSVIGIISQMGSKIGYAVPISSARFALEGWGIEFTEGGDALLPKQIVGKDGVAMILVSRGEFPMGEARQFVFLDGFYIDKEPAAPAVTWSQAAEACTAKGKRLATEAEWEKAARAQAMSVNPRRGEWVADWYQPDYPRMRPARNPSGPSTGESNEREIAQFDARLRSDAERWAESVCRVPDECRNLGPWEACWKPPCSDAQRRNTYESYYQGQMSTRPRVDMKKVVRATSDSRGGAFSRAEAYAYRCVREP